MKKAVYLLLLLLVEQVCFPCTTFFINKNGQLVFGRNYDWITGSGMVCSNQRGLAKTSFKTKDGGTISWISRFGSLTFNQYGKEFPTGGMNEKGLVVELMWLDGTRYPAADGRPAIGVLQWIQYQLDNCATVEDLIANDKKLRIANNTTPLHYLVADAGGNAATIEFLEGKMVVHRGKDLPYPVLTNDAYSYSLEQTGPAIRSTAGTHSFTNNSLDRFATACTLVTAWQKGAVAVPVVDYSFSILDKVAQGSHTKWSIVYDISNKKIFFKTLDHSQVKEIAFSAFDFDCSTPSKAWDLNQAKSGDISAFFTDFSIEMNRFLVNRSFDESTSQFTVSPEDRHIHASYPGLVTCQ